jgi:tRNA (guanine-N7-)-methyltransferase
MSEKKIKSNAQDRAFSESFTYTHNNPYHDKLEEFSSFVMRDEQAEEFAGQWNSDVFERSAPLHIEIGSGFGHFMLNYCANHPEINFVGLDHRFKRSFQLAKKLANHPHKNFRYLRAKGERIHYIFSPQEVDAIYYFFPDPWPKTRHHKKRLLQGPFLKAAYQVLKPGGKLFIKTDHDGYAKWMQTHIKQSDFTQILESYDLHRDYPDHFLAQYKTKFEKIFIDQDINIKAFILEKK